MQFAASFNILVMDLVQKRAELRSHLQSYQRLLVAYSGGIDSAYLAWEARQVLGTNILAVIADSPSLARAQLKDAVAFAQEQGIPLEILATSEMDRPDYVRNDGQRCFHCKDELFTVMEAFAIERGFDTIAYGVNLDDQGDFRPGQHAARQHGVAAPLLDAKLTKQDIRQLAQDAGLRVWDKPASACLSSRIEYGRPVTREALAAVEAGEDALRALGFRQFRVRHHGPDRAYRDFSRRTSSRAIPRHGLRIRSHLQGARIHLRNPRPRGFSLRLDECAVAAFYHQVRLAQIGPEAA